MFLTYGILIKNRLACWGTWMVCGYH